ESLHGVRFWPRRMPAATPALTRTTIGVLALSLITADVARAQEIEARAFSPAPTGTTIIAGGIGGQNGGLLFDPSLDIGDVQADWTMAIAAAGYTFGVGGRQARLLAVFPLASGRIGGLVGSAPQHQDLGGLVDPRIKLSLALRGGPALAPYAFARAPRRTI